MAEQTGQQAGDQLVDQAGQQPVWLPVAAAARRLGVTQQAVRRRLERGTLESRRAVFGNRSRLEVQVNSAPEQLPESAPEPSVAPSEVAALRERVAGLEAVVEAQRSHIADLRAEVERQRWRGIVPALRRLLWGDDGT